VTWRQCILAQVAGLDEILPAPHFRERHARVIAASPRAVWDALQELRLGELALSRTLMAVRELPARLLGRGPSRMVSGRLLEEGPVPVVGSNAGRAIVAAGVMQPWKLRGGATPPVLDAAGVRAFREPGWVKVGLDFVLEPVSGATRLVTETRVEATDARTRRLFGLYWLLILVGSGLIRRDMLRAVAARAERG
jgi:hypothetical protein